MPTNKPIRFTKAVREETDPAWRNWFMEVERRRKKAANRKERPWVFSEYDKDGQKGVIARRKSDPSPMASLLKKESAERGPTLDVELLCIRSLWNMVAGPETAAASEIYSFKAGVLTISLRGSALLQEVRQFRQEELLEGLRRHWTVATPLVRLVFRAGAKPKTA